MNESIKVKEGVRKSGKSGYVNEKMNVFIPLLLSIIEKSEWISKYERGSEKEWKSEVENESLSKWITHSFSPIHFFFPILF